MVALRTTRPALEPVRPFGAPVTTEETPGVTLERRGSGKSRAMWLEAQKHARSRPGLTRVLFVSPTGERVVELGPDGNPVIDADVAPLALTGPLPGVPGGVTTEGRG